MNPNIDKLQPYPFERLAEIKRGLAPNPMRSPIVLSVGEPQHRTPQIVVEALLSHLHGLGAYPSTKGLDALRETIADWLVDRFRLPARAIDPATQILPVNGTREALFAFAQCWLDPHADSVVVMPNPFYQIYEGAALLAGARPYFVNAQADLGYQTDFRSVPDAVWEKCRLLYICSPGNPHGAVMRLEDLQALLVLAERFDFVVASDECYSELYLNEARPPPSLLSAALAMGNERFERCVVFHSLSKRSNAPGLRSGFVAGDARVLSTFLAYRTYHGCAMGLPTQHASIAAWRDESHVRDNRGLYRAKFHSVAETLAGCVDVALPEAGFYLWLRTPIDDIEFTRRFYAQENVTVLPGQFLSRESNGANPGANHVRIALVASLEDCAEAARRLKNLMATL